MIVFFIIYYNQLISTSFLASRQWTFSCTPRWNSAWNWERWRWAQSRLWSWWYCRSVWSCWSWWCWWPAWSSACLFLPWIGWSQYHCSSSYSGSDASYQISCYSKASRSTGTWNWSHYHSSPYAWRNEPRLPSGTSRHRNLGKYWGWWLLPYYVFSVFSSNSFYASSWSTLSSWWGRWSSACLCRSGFAIWEVPASPHRTCSSAFVGPCRFLSSSFTGISACLRTLISIISASAISFSASFRIS